MSPLALLWRELLGFLGALNRLLLTPSHHRVHHARNPRYIDTSFCNLLNIWDRLFGRL